MSAPAAPSHPDHFSGASSAIIAALVSAVVAGLITIFAPEIRQYFVDTSATFDGRPVSEVSGPAVDLSGDLKRLEEAHSLWVVVKPTEVRGFYPVRASVDSERWRARIEGLGDPEPVSGEAQTFVVYLYEANPNDAAIMEAAEGVGDPGMTAVPPGAGLLATTTVSRVR